jgi:hypothetical protein
VVVGDTSEWFVRVYRHGSRFLASVYPKPRLRFLGYSRTNENPYVLLPGRTVLGRYRTVEEARRAARWFVVNFESEERVCSLRDIDKVRKGLFAPEVA